MLLLAGRLWPQIMFMTEADVDRVIYFTKYLAQEQGADPGATYIPAAHFSFLVPGGEQAMTHTPWRILHGMAFYGPMEESLQYLGKACMLISCSLLSKSLQWMSRLTK